jgi:translation elongation factor EF-1alpha
MEVEIGRVMHYYAHRHVAVLMLKRVLKIGDEIHIHGPAMDFTQRVTSMEINHASVHWAQPGDDVALEVTAPVHENDRVYRVVQPARHPA